VPFGLNSSTVQAFVTKSLLEKLKSWCLIHLSFAALTFAKDDANQIMKQIPLLQRLALGLALTWTTGETANAQTTNTITSPGFNQYSVNGVAGNPTINLIAGTTNSLVINTASLHPVVIQTAQNNLPANQYSGATPQSVNSGTIRVTIPLTGHPSVLYYLCNVHQFFGQINIIDPPQPPPRNTILSLSVGPANVVIKSTGTNTTWLFVPEFSSNLTTWAPVPSFSNSFASGTNTTTFNRLDPICGPNVYLRVNQKRP